MSEERKLAVLRAIVEDYVATQEPVGSRALVDRHHLGVSPATVRNDMAALEEEGFIAQPHTSAGRIPTDKGYRLFVDKLSHVKPLSAAEKRAITTILEGAVEELSAIAGQRAVVTKAKKSIATYKLRTGMPIGARVTLRGRRMYDFLDRLINIALPRVRDFRGVSPKAFDGRGNYTLGVRDHFIFPEIDYAKTDKSKGLNVTIVTTAGRDDRAFALLKRLGMPFASRKES